MYLVLLKTWPPSSRVDLYYDVISLPHVIVYQVQIRMFGLELHCYQVACVPPLVDDVHKFT